MARPRHLIDPGKLARALDLMRAGLSISLSAQSAGFSKRTFLRWLYEGRALAAGQKIPGAQANLQAFAEQVDKAHADGIAALFAIVRLGKPGWQGASTALERFHGFQVGRPPPSDRPDASDLSLPELIQRGIEIAVEDRNVGALVRLIELLPKEAAAAPVTMADVIAQLQALPPAERESIVDQLSQGLPA